MAWLHGWAGLLGGWALFMMFLAGTASVFKDEITAWMMPELPRAADPLVALEAAAARLGDVAPDAERWTITLPSERFPGTRIAWQPRADVTDLGPRTRREVLDAESGRVVTPRETRGGDLFYRLHYRFEISEPVRRGWWLSGAATMFMLTALATGLVVHRRFFRDLFTFRPGMGRQRSWLDAHLLLAVSLLPFHLAIAYTGLVPIMSTVMPWAVIANYGDERPALVQAADMDAARSAYSRDREDSTIRRHRAGRPAPLFDLRVLAERAGERLGGPIGSITIRNPNDANAVVEIVRKPGGELSNRPRRLYYDGVSGEPLAVSADIGPVAKVQAAMYGMHMARFAEPLLRWAYFLAGLASTVMIGAGLVVWTLKRRSQTERGRLSLVERLNVATLAGLPFAMAAYFWANRLLPLDMPERAAGEVRVFFAAWGAVLLYAALRPSRRAWIETLWLAAAAFGALPVLNALTTDRHLAASIASGDWLMAGFDLTAAATGAAFAFAGWRVARAVRGAPGPAAVHAAPSRERVEWPTPPS
ncbi:MAG TPA: PepSY-associated TM helix domain-containing protein [Gammaproteobacteria bacterium]